MELDADNDFVWLTSASAAELLCTTMDLFAKNHNPLKTAKLLRKSISPSRAALVMEQAQLRIRARRKFSDADRLFFSGKSLQQSTSSRIATYKVRRFSGVKRIADICCGIGGDLISLAKHDGENIETVGVEKDPVTAHFANANLAALNIKNAKVLCRSFEDFDAAAWDGLHFDPDRRANGRTTTGSLFEPSMRDIFDRIDTKRQLVAIKVAPATEIEMPEFPVEREWIGEWRECKQQVIWAGPSITESSKVATIIDNNGAHCQFRHPDNSKIEKPPQIAGSIGPYLYEPHASVLAAGLGEVVAAKHSLQYLSRGVAYMNGQSLLRDVEPILKCYRVDDVLPADLKLIQKKLKQHGVGQLVVKKRGVDQVLADRVSRLKLSGDRKATVMLTRHRRSRRAVLVTRMSPSLNAGQKTS